MALHDMTRFNFVIVPPKPPADDGADRAGAIDVSYLKAGALCYDPDASQSPRLRWRSQTNQDGVAVRPANCLLACPRWVHPTFDALAECAEHGVDVAVLRGNRIAALVRSAYRPPAVATRRKQYSRHEDAAAVWALARALVDAKARSQRNMLRKAAFRRNDSRLHEYADRLHAEWHALPLSGTLDSLRGWEGRIARSYFAAWPHWLGRHHFQRIPRRAHDPINLLLDICYSRLCQAITLHLLDAGFDIALGALHAEDPYRPTLALDLMEPLRPLAVDRFVLTNAHRALHQHWCVERGGRWHVTPTGQRQLRDRWITWWYGTSRRMGMLSSVKRVILYYTAWVDGGASELTLPTVES